MHNSGASHRGARTRVCCLTIESSCVVPAKAGTHSHRRLLGQKASASATKTIGHGVWVPAFAGTTKESGWACRRAMGTDTLASRSKRRIAAVDHKTIGGVIGRRLAHQIDRDAAEIQGLAEPPPPNPRHHIA